MSIIITIIWHYVCTTKLIFLLHYICINNVYITYYSRDKKFLTDNKITFFRIYGSEFHPETFSPAQRCAIVCACKVLKKETNTPMVHRLNTRNVLQFCGQNRIFSALSVWPCEIVADSPRTKRAERNTPVYVTQNNGFCFRYVAHVPFRLTVYYRVYATLTVSRLSVRTDHWGLGELRASSALRTLA